MDWNCRCHVLCLTQAQVDRRREKGDRIRTTPPREKRVRYKNRETGEILVLPDSVKPGFHRGPRDSNETFNKLLKSKLLQVEVAGGFRKVG